MEQEYKSQKDAGEFITYEHDTDLRDVRPYASEAWINLPVTKTGCEISFSKYFYKPIPLHSLEENSADILALDSENKGFIDQRLKLI